MANSKTIERIEREAGITDLAVLLAHLPPTDLQSLLLDVYRQQASKPASAVLAAYESNRFVRPSTLSPQRPLEWDRAAFASLPPEFEALALSPVAPLGTCSAVALVDQNKALSTSRNTEVVSDLTNVLALEAASRRKQIIAQNARSTERVHLAASHRLLRTQHYDNPSFSSHFSLFGLCSAGRSQDQMQFERDAFALHLVFYVRALKAFTGNDLTVRIALTDFSGQRAEFIARLFALIQAEDAAVECVTDTQRESGRGYYADLCFHVYALVPDGQTLEIGDGGVVNWTQRLLSNAKERCVISGIASERICERFPSPPAPLPGGEG
jgi:hypothetical protein